MTRKVDFTEMSGMGKGTLFIEPTTGTQTIKTYVHNVIIEGTTTANGYTASLTLHRLSPEQVDAVVKALNDTPRTKE